ncbi:hypothetical protein GGR95_003708 [Sulfitobacter undariae]|uniref:Uncharacterized protein n=1 Tax=Sulfitobacter undariae TaxID=1563671 RepID=A0A7W6EB87_9RHOB|nr:hypothetical protein [Sulfitobacter undariae]MBB3996042.1 hypothetical protein [Sulfitobacter undariae]
MKTVSIDGAQLTSLNLYRAALSEECQEKRLRAIEVVTHDVVARQINLFASSKGKGWSSKPKYSEFAKLVMASTDERYEAAIEFGQIMRRYDQDNDRKLYVAELIGMNVLTSIKAQSFQGLHSPDGILEQVRAYAQQNKVIGARNKALLLKSWRTYLGVVHLGMAMQLCAANPELDLSRFSAAPSARLSHLSFEGDRAFPAQC